MSVARLLVNYVHGCGPSLTLKQGWIRWPSRFNDSNLIHGGCAWPIKHPLKSSFGLLRRLSWGLNPLNSDLLFLPAYLAWELWPLTLSWWWRVSSPSVISMHEAPALKSVSINLSQIRLERIFFPTLFMRVLLVAAYIALHLIISIICAIWFSNLFFVNNYYQICPTNPTLFRRPTLVPLPSLVHLHLCPADPLDAICSQK